jgi:hypothetical protein
MILVVKGADFSANKIDTIDFPIELSEWTEALIAKYPNFTFTDAIKKKLELFYRKLSTNGILDKIQYLSFPVFANSISEAVANVLSDSYTPSVPAGASSVYTQTMGYGIKRSAAVSAATSLISLPSESDSIMSLKDLHIMAYPVDAVQTGNTYATTFSTFDDYNTWGFASYINTFGLGHGNHSWSQCFVDSGKTSLTGPKAYSGDGNFSISLDSNMRMGAYPMLICNNGSRLSASINAQDFVSTDSKGGYETGSTSASTSRVYFGLSPIVVDGQWSARRFGVFSLGKYLTNEESALYQTALKELVGGIVA